MLAQNQKAGFYSFIMLLNTAVVIMFSVVTTPAPVAQAYQATVTPTIRTYSVVSGIPNRLTVESVGIDTVVGVGSYDQNLDSWTLSEDQAYYADSSVPINNSNGTTLIYGHALATMFGPLSQLQVGAEAIVYTDTGRIFHYHYQSMKQLDPHDTSVFTDMGDPVLVLQTCSGAWDIYRSMYTFQYISEEHT